MARSSSAPEVEDELDEVPEEDAEVAVCDCEPPELEVEAVPFRRSALRWRRSRS